MLRVSNDVNLLVRAARATGATRPAVMLDLVRPLTVTDGATPMSELEVLFRSPHLPCVGVHDPDDPTRLGLLTRTRFAEAMTGRLGFGRAVLTRQPVAQVADWNPLVVDERTAVVETAVRAIERPVESRFDEVLVRSDAWQMVGTGELIGALVAALTGRSLHDPLTGLPSRELVRHTMREWSALLHGTQRRLVVLLVDVVEFGAINAAHGEAVGDLVLRALGERLTQVVPSGFLVGRTGGDEFMVVGLLPAAVETRAPAQREELRYSVAAGLAGSVEDGTAGTLPPVRVVAATSTPGWADLDLLMQDAQRAMRLAKRNGGGLLAAEGAA